MKKKQEERGQTSSKHSLPDVSFITTAADDTLWFYRLDDPKGIGELLESPNKWVESYIAPGSPTVPTSKTGHYFVEFGSHDADDGAILVSGICGTSVITLSGLGSGPAQMVEFWDSLDEELAKRSLEPILEVFLMPEYGRAFIHLELGEDLEFVSLFMSHVSLGLDRYFEWIKRSGDLPRKAFVQYSHGVDREEISINEMSFIPNTLAGSNPRNVRMFYEHLMPGKVRLDDPGKPCSKVCSGSLGSAREVSSGWEISIDMIFAKAYCPR